MALEAGFKLCYCGYLEILGRTVDSILLYASPHESTLLNFLSTRRDSFHFHSSRIA